MSHIWKASRFCVPSIRRDHDYDNLLALYRSNFSIILVYVLQKRIEIHKVFRLVVVTKVLFTFSIK